jgi:hypothetical protein
MYAHLKYHAEDIESHPTRINVIPAFPTGMTML